MFANEYSNYYNSHKHDNKVNGQLELGLDREYDLDREYHITEEDLQEIIYECSTGHLDGPMSPPSVEQNAGEIIDDCPQYYSDILPNLEDYTYEPRATDNRMNAVGNASRYTHRVEHCSTSAKLNEIHKVVNTEPEDIEKRTPCEKSGSEKIVKDDLTINSHFVIADPSFDRRK